MELNSSIYLKSIPFVIFLNFQTMFNRVTDILQLSRQRSLEGHLPLFTQLAEMATLKFLRGIGPEYYHVACFWDRRTPWRAKVNHLNPVAYRKKVSSLNPANYRKLSQNKIAEKAILSQFGIPTPRFLGYLHPLRGRSLFTGSLCNPSELAEMLQNSGIARLCFKSVEGWGGKGFCAADVVQTNSEIRLRPLLQELTYNIEGYCAHLLSFPKHNAWVLEEYLSQHDWYRALNPTSVNTMRLWVLQKGDQQPQLLGGYLRIGRAGSLIDNVSAGGIFARINIEHGILDAAFDGRPTIYSYPIHPDHGTPIQGQYLPYWQESKELALTALLAFPHIRFAGVDIAVGSDGPVVIELNVEPDGRGAARMGISLRDFT